MRRQKTEAPCHSRCGTIKIPSDSEPVSAEYWPKFCSTSTLLVFLGGIKSLFQPKSRNTSLNRGDTYMFESKLCLFFQVAVQMSNFAIIFCKRWSFSILKKYFNDSYTSERCCQLRTIHSTIRWKEVILKYPCK